MARRTIAMLALCGGALLGGQAAVAGPSGAPPAPAGAPRAVEVARATRIPDCSVFVDAAAKGGEAGSAAKPFRTIAAALKKAKAGAVVCVAEGTYPEQLEPGEKHVTLAGGFRSGAGFKVRDSAKHVSLAKGKGGSFFSVPNIVAPTGDALTAIDGFEIAGYSQAIVRDFYISQRFEITNNHIHDNVCSSAGLAGAAFSINNVSGTIRDNVIRNNRCDRGGGGAVFDNLDENTVSFENNLVVGNEGVEPQNAHGGGLYFFASRLKVTGNEIVGNRVTGWGGGLYVGAFTPGGQRSNATLSWNVYRGNRAGIFGGGFFCDDGARCVSDHEVFDGNCGGNVYVDGGSGKSGPTEATFDHMTNVNARGVGCKGGGVGVQVDKDVAAPDSYSFTNSIFWNNGKALDFATGCSSNCDAITLKVSYSMIQKRYTNFGVDIDFGAGILAPKDPRFVAPGSGDFHLKSKFGHFTPKGYVEDSTSSPALARGDPKGATGANPDCAGARGELGAYGDSAEASCVK